jgi:hypothetical protein
MKYVVVIESTQSLKEVEQMIAAAVASANDGRWRGCHYEPPIQGFTVTEEGADQME